MNVERVFRILWGSNLENQMDFAFPVVGSSPTLFRQPRPDSQLIINGTSNIARLTGRYYRLKVRAQYFGYPQNFGALGLQAFIDWAADSNSFTLVPNLSLPTLTVPGCYLEGPFTLLSPTLERDTTQTLDLTILHPSTDLGIAWRGLWLEWTAGADITRPGAYPGYSYKRNQTASTNFESGWKGTLVPVGPTVLRDGHFYPGGGGTWTAAGGNVAGAPPPGLQTALLEPGRTNLALQSNALATAPWTFDDSGSDTATNAAYIAPDGTITATRVVEGATTSTHGRLQNFVNGTFTAGRSLAVSAWWRPGQRTKGELIFSGNVSGYIGVDFDLNADGTLTLSNAGGSTLTLAGWIGPYPGDWYWIWMVGQVDPATTTGGSLQLRMRNGAGSNNYLGDVTQGCYWWGAQLEDLSFAPAANFGLYAPSSTIITAAATVQRAADVLNFPAPTPQAMWYYLKFIELGTTLNSAGDACRLISFGAGSPQATWIEASSGKYIADYLTGGVQIGSPTGPLSVPRYGDVIELLVVIDTDLTIRMNQFIRRLGVEELSGKSGAGNPFPSNWTFGVINVNAQGAGSYGLQGLAQIRSGPLATLAAFQVTNMFAARAA